MMSIVLVHERRDMKIQLCLWLALMAVQRGSLSRESIVVTQYLFEIFGLTSHKTLAGHCIGGALWIFTSFVHLKSLSSCSSHRINNTETR